MRKVILQLAALSIFGPVLAQINPEGDPIFREGEVAVIRITMSESDKAFMLDEQNIWSDVYLSAQFRFTNSQIDETLPLSVGIRLRGNTSRSHPKKSFKIKFKEFGGEKFYDLKKFNLKAENNDPAMVREMLSMRIFREFNVPAARTHHAEVYINDEYMGLYLNVEQIDDEFVQSRFDDDTGNLYKCSWGATLEDNGQIFDDGTYELESNKAFNDRSVLAQFVNVLNNTAAAHLETELEAVFNVQSYLRYLAVEALTGHWDGYSYNQNNFYLYENPESGLVEFIPYDTDNTFGMDWVNRDWGTREVLDWIKHGDPRPLSTKILSRSKYLNQYTIMLDDLLNSNFSTAYFFPEFDVLKEMLRDPISRDPYFPLTFGFTMDSFENSYDMEVVGHAPYGLKPYVTARATTAREQIGIVTSTFEELISRAKIYPNPSNGRALVIESNDVVNQVTITNMMGQRVAFQLAQEADSRYVIDFDISPGIYLLTLDGRSQRFSVR